jgi:hypothetical protein
LNQLNNSYVEFDISGVADCAHKLKATIDILKIDELHEVIREMDTLHAANKNQQKLAQLICKTNEVMSQVLSEIKDSYLHENRI